MKPEVQAHYGNVVSCSRIYWSILAVQQISGKCHSDCECRSGAGRPSSGNARLSIGAVENDGRTAGRGEYKRLTVGGACLICSLLDPRVKPSMCRPQPLYLLAFAYVHSSFIISDFGCCSCCHPRCPLSWQLQHIAETIMQCDRLCHQSLMYYTLHLSHSAYYCRLTL